MTPDRVVAGLLIWGSAIALVLFYGRRLHQWRQAHDFDQHVDTALEVFGPVALWGVVGGMDEDFMAWEKELTS